MTKSFLIILPGWGMNGIEDTIWKNFTNYLLQDYHLLSLDWSNVHSLNDFKKCIIKIIKQKQIFSFSLLGWSLGALVALDLASDSTFDIEHLILIGSTSSFIAHKEEYSIGWDKRILEKMKFLLFKQPKKTLYNFYNAMFSTRENQMDYHNLFLQLKADALNNYSIDSLTLGLDYLIHKDLRNKLSSITVPTLLIHGEEDTICPLKAAIYIKNRISNCKIEILNQTGHIPFFTNPIACSKAISDFKTKFIIKEGNYDR